MTEIADSGEPFACPRCGARSFNKTDIAEGYCGRCHDWTGPRRPRPPQTGTWEAGDWFRDHTGAVWTCTAGGTGPAAEWERTPAREDLSGKLATTGGDTDG